jgi:hypothetical protein
VTSEASGVLASEKASPIRPEFAVMVVDGGTAAELDMADAAELEVDLTATSGIPWMLMITRLTWRTVIGNDPVSPSFC